MMKGLKVLVFTAFCSLVIVACDSDQPAKNAVIAEQDSGQAGDLQKLQPFEKFFAPVAYEAPQISPDGKWLSWIAPVNGVNNFFVTPTDDLDHKSQLTFKTEQGVRPADTSGVVMYQWSADSRYIIYPHDYAGDENWDIWRVEVSTGEEKNLTPSPDKSYQISLVSEKIPTEIAVTAKTFGKSDWVLSRLTLTTGALTEVQRASPGVIGVIPNHDLIPAVAIAFNAEGAFDVLASQDGEWQKIHSISMENLAALQAAGDQKVSRISRDNKTLYTYDSTGRDTSALVSFNLATGSIATLAFDNRVDLGAVIYEPETFKPLAYMAEWVRRSWQPLDESVSEDLEILKNQFPSADFRIVSQSRDNALWVVQFLSVDYPMRYQLYNRESQGLTELALAQPALADMKLAKTYSTVIESSDGLPLISYYTLPPGSDSDDNGIPDRPLPTVMIVHGGPSDERAGYFYGEILHWLGNRGYATYNMNFRGSAGFGKAYSNAANGEWGGKMHTDLLEQLDELIDKGVIDSDRVAILGGSYGGYATLVGMTMTPDRFTCGVSVVGPSNVMVPMPHWTPEWMSLALGGDPRTEEGMDHLRAISPVTHAQKTTGAVLVGQGANDSRVPKSQSDQIVDIMQEAGAKVTYVVYDDEGHGFLQPPNQQSFWGVTEVFLAQCLGGRSESIGDKLNGSSIRVPVGAKYIPGLEQALAAKTAPDSI